MTRPNFNLNITSLSDPLSNIGGWNVGTGIANGPIGFGSDVKFASNQVHSASKISKIDLTCIIVPFSVWFIKDGIAPMIPVLKMLHFAILDCHSQCGRRILSLIPLL